MDSIRVFEIGSITKVFTTAVLQDMVERGAVQLDDPVAKFLPRFTSPVALSVTLRLVASC